MKRLLLSVFAVAVTAAWAVPSTAADVTFSGQYRLRAESRNNADFISKDDTKASPARNANDHVDFWGQRVRLTANAKATDDTTVKITLQDTRMWGAAQAAAGGPSLTDGTTGANGTNTLDLHESYVNIANLFGAPVSLRAGRQELVYGDERLVGAFNWSNSGRSFDALKLMVGSEVVDVDLFTSKIAEAGASTGIVTNNTGRDQDFNGIYATVKAIPNNTVDLYVLMLRDNSNGGTSAGPWGNNTTLLGTFNKTSTITTYGVRVKGAVVGLDYTLELPMQTGNLKTRTSGATARDYNYKISGKAFAAKAGYTLPVPMKLRVGAEYDYASGDKSPGGDGTGVTTATKSGAQPDEKLKTFFNLFPTNHDKLGLMDEQGWRNVRAWNLNLSVEPLEKLKLFASYWKFSLDAKEDGWYAASNWNNTPASGRHIVQTDVTKQSKDVGRELDLVATWKYNSAVTLEAGAARFFAGKFVKNQLTSLQEKGDEDWAYLMLTANF